MKNKLHIIASATLAVSALSAHAHGEEEHAKPRKFDAARAEATDFGQEGDPEKVVRTVRVDMADTMRFTPAEVTVKRGQTVRFVVHNGGKVLHEMVLGTKQAIAEHAELMKKHPGMEHDEPHMIHVGPGKSGEMGWRFTRAGEFFYGCLVAGHFEAGMLGRILVKEK